MSLYSFDDDSRAVLIHRPQVPHPWINYLSNGRLHAFVSQAGGGFAWWKTPTLFRLTRYRMFHLPIDSPGFYVYVRPRGAPAWSPTWRPCETPLDEWQAAHRPGRTAFTARKGDLAATLELFVAPDHDALVWDLRLSNVGAAGAECDVFAYVELSQFGWLTEVLYGYYVRHHLRTWFEADSAALCYLFRHERHVRQPDMPLVYFAGTAPVESFSGDRDAFAGWYRSERNPAAVERGRCGNESLPTGQPCAALHNRVSVAPGGERRLGFFLGAAPEACPKFPQALAAMKGALSALRAEGAIDEQRQKLDAWWAEHLAAFEGDIPDADARRQINLWTPVQCVHTARYSRAVNTWAPGVRGVGFRDTCQDMLSMATRKPDWARRELLFLLSQQFADGHTVHTSFPEDAAPPEESLRSDDHLWPVMLAHALVCETGEPALLRQRVPYLAADLKGTDGEGSVWEHLLAAMRFTETHLGDHGIPLTFHSDWNDIIGKFSVRGRGESVFAGQQYAYVLRLMRELAEALGDAAAAEQIAAWRHKQLAALAACAWDGDWWRRGFDDDGNPVGSRQCGFGKIFLNPQSWAVLADCGTDRQRCRGMDQVADQLDTGVGLKIITPGFATWPEETDPFSGYAPGTGENAAIFCHANTWAVIAEAMLGNATRAWKYFRQLIPHLAAQHVGVERYQAEPYAWVSNIVGPENPRFGWANVEQVTGTAAWMDIAPTQYLLGVRAEIAGLRVDPCTPPEWGEFRVRRRFRGCDVDIRVRNDGGVEKGVAAVRVDGREIDLSRGPVIPAAALAAASARIEVTMGG